MVLLCDMHGHRSGTVAEVNVFKRSTIYDGVIFQEGLLMIAEHCVAGLQFDQYEMKGWEKRTLQDRKSTAINTSPGLGSRHQRSSSMKIQS